MVLCQVYHRGFHLIQVENVRSAQQNITAEIPRVNSSCNAIIFIPSHYVYDELTQKHIKLERTKLYQRTAHPLDKQALR